MAEEAQPTVTFMKKGKGRPGGLRKRPAEDATTSATAAETSTSEVIIATRKSIANPLIQGTGLSKRRKKEDSDANLALSDSEEEKDSVLIRHSAATHRPRRRSSSPPAEISEETIKEAAKPKGYVEEIKDDGMYRGSAKQAHNLPKAFGPVKGGPGNVRTITMVDYQPDVCKDYKETGFCGFGDSCKFLHDRGDYLHGWQLDNQFLSNNAASGSFMARQNARNGGSDNGDDSDSENEDLPFACLICREPFGKEPIVTLCGHYFDSACAIKRFAKTGKCFACGKGTNGVFNKATKLIAKQKEADRLQKLAEAEEREFEEDASDDGLEIEGLERVERVKVQELHRPERRDEDDDEEEEEEEEVPKKVKRRPIVTVE